MKRGKQTGLRPEYRREDFKRKGVRGKYLVAYRAANNLVLLKPRVAAAFPTEEAVNEALSSLIDVAEQTVRSRSRYDRSHKQRA
jgi:hypothetical protein